MLACLDSAKLSPPLQILFPMPVASWETVLRGLAPGQPVTRGRVRTYRSHGMVSSGVTVTRRSTHRLRGKGSYNSTLWVWADRCRTAGAPNDASALREAARGIESHFGSQLASYLSDHDLSDLPAAPFYRALASETAKALVSRRCLTRVVLAAGRLTSLTGSTGQLTGHTPEGQAVTVDLLAQLLTRRGLHVGACLWVVSRLAEDAALVEVDPAVSVRLPASVAKHFQWATAPVEELAPPPGWSPEAETDAVLAKQYEAKLSSRRSERSREDLLADLTSGRIPRLRLHPLG